MRTPQDPPAAGAGSDAAAPEAARTSWLEGFLAEDRFLGVSLADVLLVLGVLLGAWLLARVVRGALTRAFARRGRGNPRAQAVVLRLAGYVIMTLAGFVALNLIGIELTSLFAAGAVFAVVIGFALQRLTENVVSGVVLMVERSITPGDVLEVDGRIVRVVRMGIRATVARTRDDEDLVIPNAKLVTETIKNLTLRDSSYRLRASVGVRYESDVREVFAVLRRLAERAEWRDRSRDPRVLLMGFGTSSIDFEVSVFIQDPWTSRVLGSQLHEAIWEGLREAGIVIAYPQIDLHLDREGLRALERR